LINLRKILIALVLLDLDRIYVTQNLGNRRLKYQNLDFKELNSSIRLGCDDYGEAIVNVWICGAQGQMSQDLTAAVDICETGGPILHAAFFFPALIEVAPTVVTAPSLSLGHAPGIRPVQAGTFATCLAHPVVTVFVVNDPIEIRLDGEETYIKRPGKDELKTKIVQRIRQQGQPPAPK